MLNSGEKTDTILLKAKQSDAANHEVSDFMEVARRR